MKKKRIAGIMIVLLMAATSSFAQGILSKSVSLDVNRQRLDNVLEILSNKGNFYFSYNSNIVRKDSLVTLSARNKTVKEILNLLFNTTYEFKESGNYIIIRKAPIRLTMVTNKAVTEDRVYSVSGYVYDEPTGFAIDEASVYEKKSLASALTNNEGFFKIKLKNSKTNAIALTVSKEFYEDTTIVIEPRHDQQVTVTMMPIEREENVTVIAPEDFFAPDSLKHRTIDSMVRANIFPVRDSVLVERTGMGRFLLSAKQKAQTINLKKFFTSRPFQISFTPGLSTHGKMSSQVVNNFSLNVLGGYTAGTNGIEVGGLFNIDKKEVKFMQVAGLFNVDGGKMTGFQAAGINNTVLDSTRGMQTAGISNMVKGKFTGFQSAGIYNHVTDSVKGLQIAGIMNFSNKQTSGVQIAGVINYSKRLKGVQIGLINISDTSDGYSIGLINIVLKGYHKLSFYTNEIMNVNAAFKTGNAKLYSILQAGVNAGNGNRVYSFGYGLGGECMLNRKKSLSLNPEVGSQYLYLGSWNYTNILNKLELNLNVRFGKYLSIFAGPSFSVFVSDQKTAFAGYRFPIPPSGYHVIDFSNKVTGWFGWTAGINFF